MKNVLYIKFPSAYPMFLEDEMIRNKHIFSNVFLYNLVAESCKIGS